MVVELAAAGGVSGTSRKRGANEEKMKGGTMKATPLTMTHPEPEAARRKLVAALRKRAVSKRYTPAERAEFARIADAWAATLPGNK
ncbi:MAG: hypothetical protein JWP03_70 [Phycisphaerales bacterium]|jgi:hypothetical protein|nr:hypothetical protein [Phycisphaerales bacterium]